MDGLCTAPACCRRGKKAGCEPVKSRITCARCQVKIKILLCVSLCAVPVCAEEPIIPPSLSKIWPVGMERGSTATFTLDGRNLSGAKAVIFDAPGITAKVTQITDLPEEAAIRKFSTQAAVPLAKKQSALLEITVARDVPSGVYRFRLQTPLGTTN